MKKIIKASQRYFSNHRTIQSHFLFSFADYYDPENMNFWDIRVFNDDFIATGAGFPMHPHKHFEILTYMHQGTITHKDSLWNIEKIRTKQIQVTNTGRGIEHSEFNEDDEGIYLYQLWFSPKKLVSNPSYFTADFSWVNFENTLITLASGIEENKNMLISEVSIKTWVFDVGQTTKISLSPYVLLYVTSWKVEIEGEILSEKDQLRIQGEKDIELHFLEKSEIFIVESL